MDVIHWVAGIGAVAGLLFVFLTTRTFDDDESE